MASKCKTRKKPTQLLLQESIEIHQKVNAGIDPIKIAANDKIHKITVSRIKYNKKYKSMKQEISLQTKRKNPFKYKNLDDQLKKWYLEQKTLGNTITKKLLYKKAKKLINIIGGPLLSNQSDWLQRFEKRYNIQYTTLQLSTSISVWYEEVDNQLLNWLLELIISKDKISPEMLRNKTNELMDEYGGPSTDNAIKCWLNKFRKCHEILIKPNILQNSDQRGDETNLSDLDEQLFKWLVKQKNTGDKITHEILMGKTLNLIHKFSKPLTEKEKESWIWRIRNRYIASNFQTASKILQRDDDTDQSDAETSIKNVIEEDIVLKEIPKVLSPSGKSRREEYQNQQQNIISVEITEGTGNIKNIEENKAEKNNPIEDSNRSNIAIKSTLRSDTDFNEILEMLNYDKEEEEYQQQQENNRSRKNIVEREIFFEDF